MGSFGDLFVSIATALLAFFWIYVVMDWMVEGQISGPTGIATIIASVLMIGVGISAPSELVDVRGNDPVLGRAVLAAVDQLRDWSSI